MTNKIKNNKKTAAAEEEDDEPDAGTSTDSPYSATTPPPPPATKVVEAAAIAGAAAGLVVGGPAVSVASAAGAAYLASSTDNGTLGEVSRRAGETTVLDLKNQAQEIWHQNDDGPRNLERGVEQVKTFEKEHRLLERLQSLVGVTYRTVTDWAEEHNVAERTKAAVAKGTTFAVMKIQQCTGRGTAVDQ